jgi:hypothetical protein
MALLTFSVRPVAHCVAVCGALKFDQGSGFGRVAAGWIDP